MPDDTAARVAGDLVAEAVRAPSSHNTQPWLFEIEGGTIRLLADRTRALPVNDPHDRELTISCGCALMTMRVAAAAAGLGARVHTLPDAQDPDLLARIEPCADAPDPALAALHPGIAARRTHRARFAPTEIAPDAVRALRRAAEAEGCWLEPIEGQALREAVAALVARGDEAQWDDPSWRRELAAWMHPRRDGDGLSLPWLVAPVARMVVRSFDMGGGVAARDRELADHSPLLAVLGTARDGEADWLAAGQALQRLLLAGQAEGLQASYLNQPIQVASLRGRLAETLGCVGYPQILLRLGHPEEDLPAAPRRPPEAAIAPRKA